MTNVAAPRRSNRRLTARLACQLTVRYRARKDWHPATAMDVSRNGCRLRLGEDLARGAALSVVFEQAGREGVPARSADVPGSVIWSRLEGLSYQVGIQFRSDPPELQEILAGAS